MTGNLTLSGTRQELQRGPATRLRALIGVRGLLACGVISSVLYVAADVWLSLSYDGYSYASQWVSELAAKGAPTRTEWLAVSVPYTLLVLAFAAGLWMAAGSGRGHRAALMLVGYAGAGMVGAAFFPMDQRDADETFRGSMHGPVTMVMSVFLLLAMGFGAGLFGRRWRRYSWATIAILILCGALTALYVPRITAGESTPGTGLVERVNIYATMLWFVVLSVALLRSQAGKREA